LLREPFRERGFAARICRERGFAARTADDRTSAPIVSAHPPCSLMVRRSQDK
jgi:hypothetical protein